MVGKRRKKIARQQIFIRTTWQDNTTDVAVDVQLTPFELALALVV